jgi:hypothetical protein
LSLTFFACLFSCSLLCALLLLATALARRAALLRSGVKYMVVRSYPNGSSDDGLATIYFKKPRGGGCFVVTNQAAIIGTFDEGKGQTASQCNFAVEALGRYLYSSGY